MHNRKVNGHGHQVQNAFDTIQNGYFKGNFKLKSSVYSTCVTKYAILLILMKTRFKQKSVASTFPNEDLPISKFPW